MQKVISPLSGFSIDRLSVYLQKIWTKTYIAQEGKPRQPTLLGHCLIGSGVIAINVAGFVTLNSFAASRAQEWLSTHDPLTVPAQSMVQPAILQSRLEEQLSEIQERRDRHAKVMVYFYKQYFISLSMASGSALAAILMAFFISRDGWEKSNNGLINAFLLTFSAALLYTQIPGMFQQEKNLKANRELYLAYDALGNQVLSYLATENTIGADPAQPNKVDKVTPEQFIPQVDQQLAKLNQLPLDFDANQVIKLPDLQQFGLPQGLQPMSSTPTNPAS